MTIVWNAQRVSEGLAEIQSARLEVLTNIKTMLDRYNAVDRSLRFYDLILGDWVERYLHLVYVVRQDYSLTLCRVQKDENLTDAMTICPSGDTAEFFAAYRTLPALMLSVLQSLSSRDSIDVADYEVSIHNSVKARSRERFNSLFFKLVSNSSNSRVLFVKPFSGRTPKTWLSAMFKWRKWATHDDLDFKFSVRVKVDSIWRRQNVGELPVGASLSATANAILSLFLPVCAVEGLAKMTSLVNRAKPRRFDVVYSAQALWTHFAFKLLIANWCEQGTKLHYHQHGGWYGLDEIHVGEQYESRVADVYYTWGWNRGQDNLRFLPPAIPRLRERDKFFDSMICFDQPQQVYRLQYFPLPGTLQNMYDQTADFVRTRVSDKELRIRLFPGDYGSKQKEAILRVDSNAMFDNSQQIFSQYSQSRIVFHNYLGTSWLETLGNNIPTICFFDKDAYRFRSDAKNLLDDLVKVGILHLSGSSAATMANAVEGEIDSWWLSQPVQSARRNFVSKFANFSSDWQEIWRQTFEQILKSIHGS